MRWEVCRCVLFHTVGIALETCTGLANVIWRIEWNVEQRRQQHLGKWGNGDTSIARQVLQYPNTLEEGEVTFEKIVLCQNALQLVRRSNIIRLQPGNYPIAESLLHIRS